MGCRKLSYYQGPRQIGKNHFFIGEPLEKRDTGQKKRDDYYPFGLPITQNNYQEPGNEENRFLYQGKEWQTALALNLYDFHARQYDPATGRFTGVDPAGQFASGYVGMGNMPTMGTDPDGEIFGLVGIAAILVKGAIVGAAVGAVGYTASVGFSDGGFGNWDWGQFGKAWAWELWQVQQLPE